MTKCTCLDCTCKFTCDFALSAWAAKARVPWKVSFTTIKFERKAYEEESAYED